LESTISKKSLYRFGCFRCGYSWDNSSSDSDSCPICFYLERVDKIIKNKIPKITLLKIEKNRSDVVAKYDLYDIEIKVVLKGYLGAGMWISSKKGRDHASWSLGVIESHIIKLIKTYE
jgi:hypothetical protein